MTKPITTTTPAVAKADPKLDATSAEATRSVRLGDSLSPWADRSKVRLGDSLMPW